MKFKEKIKEYEEGIIRQEKHCYKKVIFICCI